MNPRLQRLALDWKTYVALVAATGTVMSALTATMKEAANTVSVFKDLSPEARWFVAAVFLLLTIVFLLAALSRRSILLEPKRFLLSSENPEHLVGREEEVEHLARQCRRHSMVFLVGDSGSGKSSLVRAGLAHSLLAKDSALAVQDFVPLVVDLSSLGWQRGLSLALARGLSGLPEDAWQALGGGERSAAEDVFTWLRNRPSHAPRRLLMICDQFDDYLAAHRSQFYDGTTLRRPQDIESLSVDWHGVAELLRSGSVCLLVVARSEAAGSLPALCFVEEAAIAREHLTRLPGNLVAPLLNRLGEPLDGHPVISDPEFGWLQLRSRLLRDLQASGEGQILPIQLAVALNSLRLSRYLTPAEYERNGGLRGLERLHVERHAEKAATAARVSTAAVLEALMTMVNPDGSKTRPVSRADFCSVLARSGAAPEAAGRAIIQLEDDRLVRRVPGDGEGAEILFLYHDYLARGVREAYRQVNRWTELLRERAQLFQEAIGWRQRWRALISPADQSRLLWERFRGRFSFDDKIRFFGLSALRWLPIALALLLVGIGGWEVERYRRNQIAGEVMQAIGHDKLVTEEEARQILRLGAAGRGAIDHALRLATADAATAARASGRMDQLLVLALGLDTQGERSGELAEDILAPAIRISGTGSVSFAAEVASRLRLTPWVARQVANSIVERMRTEPDSELLLPLGEALEAVSARLSRQDAATCVAVLIERMKTETDGEALQILSEAVGSLSANLERQDLAPGAAALVARMRAAPDTQTLMAVGWSLRPFSSKLERQDLAPGAAALVARMQVERDMQILLFLNFTLGSLSTKLERQDVAPGAAVLVAWMKNEPDSAFLGPWSSSLSQFSEKLDRQDVAPVAALLVARMKSEPESDVLAFLGELLGRFSPRLESQDVAPGAALLAARMMSERDRSALASLGWALCSLSTRLESQNVASLAATLVARMRNESDSGILVPLSSTLGGLSKKLERRDVAPGAAVLAARMQGEPDSRILISIGSALGSLIEKLERQDVAPLAATLVARMKSEPDSGNLTALGSALGFISARLESRDITTGAAVLAARMRTETDLGLMASLGSTLGSLSAKLERQDVAPFAAALVARMQTEDDVNILASLGSTLGSLIAKLERQDVAPGAAVLVARMKNESNADVLARLGKAFGSLSAKLQDDGKVVPAFEALAIRAGREWNERILSDLTKGLISLAPALPNPVSISIYPNPVRIEQIYVDLLKSPFMVGDARVELLKGLEQATGQTFSGYLWTFVDWATGTEDGRRLELDLDGPPPWKEAGLEANHPARQETSGGSRID